VTKGTSWRPFFIVIAALFIVIASLFLSVIASRFLPVIASVAWQSREDQILNPKSEILNNMKRQSVISSQQLAASQ